MTDQRKFIYTSAGAKKTRLDVFLSEQLPDISRSRIQKLIQCGEVLVNEHTPSVHQFLKDGDVVMTLLTQSPRSGKFPKQERKATFALDIVAHTDDYLIINKPAGLLVHPTASPDTRERTLVDMLLAYDASLGKIGEDPGRPTLVHRLDRDVSGIMIIPRTFAMFEYLKREFKLRRIEKRYTALVYGVMTKDEGEIDFVISRAATGGKMAARPKSQDGKSALTTYKVRERYRAATLVDVQIHTGRTHQIRAHLLAISHPVVGDILYMPKKKPAFTAPFLMLHAEHLGFSDLQNEWKNYSVEPPKEFFDFLKQCS